MDNKSAILSMQLKQMLSTSNASLATSTLLAAILAYVQYDVIASTVVLSWFFVIVLFTLFRAALVIYYLRPQDAEYATTHKRIVNYRLGVLISGLVWGSSGFLMFPANDSLHQLFLIFMLAGLTAGGVVSYSADLFSTLGFSVATLAPLVIRFFVAGDKMSIAMGMAIVLYLGFMVLSGRIANHHIRENIVLRLEASSREQAIRASENRYRLLLRHSPVGIFHYDINLIITYCNDNFANILKTTADRIVGLNMNTLKDQSVLPSLRNTLNGELNHYEGPYFATLSDANGWIAMTCSPSLDNNETIVGGIAVVQDITERKQAEKTLQYSEQRLRNIIETEPECIKIVDNRGKLLEMNSAGLAMLEADSLEEAKQKNLLEYIDPEYQAAFLSLHHQVIDGKSGTLEFKIKGLKGTPRWLETHATPMHDSNNETTFLLGVTRDITERKLAERQILEEQRRFHDFSECTADWFWEMDADLRFSYFSDNFEDNYGLKPEMVLGKTRPELLAVNSPNSMPTMPEHVKLLNDHLPFRNFEYCIRTDAGELRWLSVSGVPVFRSDGCFAGYRGVGQNITERINAKAKLQAKSDELELHNRILRQVNLGVDSHKILTELLTEIENLHSGIICSILLLDVDGKHLRHGAGPSLPSLYSQAVDGLPIGDGIGSCGTAAFLGKRVIVEDINTHPYWAPYRDLASHAGLQSCWSQPVIGSTGSVLGTFAIYHRIACTPSQAEIDLVESYANLVQLVIENSRTMNALRTAATAFESVEGMIVTDAESNILRVNRAFTEITGYSAEEVIGSNPRIFGSGLQDANFYAAMWNSINDTGKWEGEIWNRRKNGEIYPEHLSINAVKDGLGAVINYVANVNDISLRHAAEDEIKHLAFFDPLTHLPNRRLLLDRLQQALVSSGRSEKKGALLFIDLDNFKTLNDTLGHDIGDLLLQQVARRLESCVREGDTVARLGGDEFVVMLEDLSGNDLEAAAQTEVVGNKVLVAVNKPYRLDTHEHHSTPSIGATLFNKQNSIDELMKQADIAMYQAKKAGRNTLRFFDKDMQFLVDARMSLETELRKAIDERQFHLYYQIQVDQAQRPLGAEALIRWHHPQRGLISPAEFIPIAEEMGLIHTIGWWVLKTACAQLKAWQDEPQTCHLILAVNVSAKQFHQTDFAEQVKTAIQLYNVNPTRLKLELTEGVLLEKIESTIATMNELRDAGVGFALDDFGTGYSSLQYLKRLPITQLKIDQSFVRDIPVDKSDRTIVSTIIAMAQSLKLDVIAEGVETEEQREILQSNGCNHYQGYLYGKPVPIEQFEKVLKRDSVPVDHTSMMLRLNWHKSYDCGEYTIDQEHCKLFDLANTLIESAFTRNENPKGFDEAVEELLAHVVKHFADEEALLALHHYADLGEHKFAHKVLIDHALQLRKAAAEGGITVGEWVNFIAGDVVAQHMLKEDRKFYPLFKKE